MIVILGERYKHKLHKITGIAMAYAEYYTGCNQVCLEVVVGGLIKEMWIDVSLLEPIEPKKKPKKKEPVKKLGGPQSHPPPSSNR